MNIKISTRLLGCSLCVSGMMGVAAPAFAAETQLASYDFSGISGTMPSGWRGNTGFILGRGYFESPGRLNGSGQLNVDLRTYNTNRSNSNQFFQQGMRTNASYSPASKEYIKVTARIKISHTQKGLVHGFFMYSDRTVSGARLQDEIDFEWLTNDTSRSSTNDNVNVSSWNDWNIACGYNGSSFSSSCGQQTSQTVASGENTDGNTFNNYEIKWFGSGKVEFRVNGSLKKTISGRLVPSGQTMPVFLNSWAPDSSWTQAYNSTLSVTQNSGQSKTYRMVVDELKIFRGTI